MRNTSTENLIEGEMIFLPNGESEGGQPSGPKYDHLYEGTQWAGTDSIPYSEIFRELGVEIGQTLRLVIRTGFGSDPDVVQTDELITRVTGSSYRIVEMPKSKHL